MEEDGPSARMARAIAFVVPGRLDARTGGSIYDRRMVEGLRRLGWTVRVLELEGTFPFLSPPALEEAVDTLAAVPDATVTVVDGLVLSAMADTFARASSRLRVVALMHLPLSADLSLDRSAAACVAVGEREAIGRAARVIVTGSAALRLLAFCDLPSDRVTVVEPGTDPVPLARGSGSATVTLLSVATLNPLKGHELLLDALASVPSRAWRLVCVGSLTRDPSTVDRVRAAARRLALDDRVTFTGDLDGQALEACYHTADAFVLATRQETYGMAVAEALAHGLPVVSTTTGAIPDLVGDEAGLLVPPGDAGALSAALARVLGDAALRARLAEGARRVRNRLPDWEQACARMAAVLDSLHSDG